LRIYANARSKDIISQNLLNGLTIDHLGRQKGKAITELAACHFNKLHLTEMQVLRLRSAHQPSIIKFIF
jgi:hypothetical protein